jgi:Cys-tRNA(Pro) deacylase
MTAKEKFPNTRAVRMLKAGGASFRLHAYAYEPAGGTRAAATRLGVDEHMVVKTLAMEDEKGTPFLILMHGDRRVSTKKLARRIGVKSVRPCDPKAAFRHTGYMVGGMSPFGVRKALRVYVEESVLALPVIYINAGKRGLLAEISPGVLKNLLDAEPVAAAA